MPIVAKTNTFKDVLCCFKLIKLIDITAELIKNKFMVPTYSFPSPNADFVLIEAAVSKKTPTFM